MHGPIGGQLDDELRFVRLQPDCSVDSQDVVRFEQLEGDLITGAGSLRTMSAGAGCCVNVAPVRLSSNGHGHLARIERDAKRYGLRWTGFPATREFGVREWILF